MQDSIFINKVTIDPIHSGILDGLTFAVKDVIDIQGQRTGCGNPIWLSQQPVAEIHAHCVEQLLANGGKCLGKTVLGEFCSGSTGINHFYGMPLNPKSPERVPGGSSSGSASAVALAVVDFALGTDAAGSVRLPASFCGIYGMRPSDGVIPMTGVKSFAPSFDTIGIFSKTIDILSCVFDALVGKSINSGADKIDNFYVLADYLLLVNEEQQNIFQQFIKKCCDVLQLKPVYIKLTDIHPDANDKELGISAIFKKLLCAEIWEILGEWVKKENLEYSKGTYVDFSYMASIDRDTLSEPLKRKNIYAAKLRKLLSPGNLLCIPTTPDVAPLRNIKSKFVNEFDYEKLRPLVSLASVAGLPQINIPLEKGDSPPIGISLLGGYQLDYLLINAVKNIVKNGVVE